MSNIVQHATLPEERLHYPKGASTAAINTWMKANGDGTTSFDVLPKQTLAVSDTLNAHSDVDQILETANEVKQVLFGDDKVSTNGAISVNSTGDIVVNEDGVYAVTVSKTTCLKEDGEGCVINFKLDVNDTQKFNTSVKTLDKQNSYSSSSETQVLELKSGDSLKYYMLARELPAGKTGLFIVENSVENWENTPSSSLNIVKLGV